MPKISKYRIYCTTDSKWVYIWDTIQPITCPDNVGHTVNSNSSGELHTILRTRTITDTNSPYTISGHNFYLCDTTSGSITVNLKSAALNKDRVIIFVKTASANTVVLDPFSTETIDGSSTYTLSALNENIKIISNGTNWDLLEISSSTGDDLLDGVLYNDNFSKGDIIVDNGLDITNIAGADNTFLKADSTQPNGVLFVTETVLGDSNVAALAGINTTKLADGSVTNTEFQYINSLTSNAQNQFDDRTVGPASSTDNAIVRYDGTTGKLVQNSAILVDDSSNISGLGYVEFIDISAPINPGAGIGRLYKLIGNDGIWWKPDAAGTALDLTVGSTLTAAEVSQLENINLTAISATQWGYLGSLNQALATTDSVTFAGINSTAAVDIGNNKITSLANPTAASDAANKYYVDSIAQGLSVKDSVRATTTTAGTLATDYANSSVIDGVTLVTNDRILIKNQTNPIENGIYIVQASGAPVRAVDLATGTSAASVFVFVAEGSQFEDSGWVCITNKPADIVDTDPIAWVQFSGAGQITAGIGLSKLGNTLDVNVDTTSIEIVADTLRLVNAPTVKGDLLTHNGTVQTKLAMTGTNNYVLVSDSSASTGMKWAEVPIRTWVVKDQKATGTNGGTATGDNTWRTRVLNTVSINGGSEVTLASNQLTLSTGTYHITVVSSFYRCDSAKIRVQNITDASTVEYSANITAANTDRSSLQTNLSTYISITSAKVIEIQYACITTRANDGLGLPDGITGIPEIYTVVTLRKL